MNLTRRIFLPLAIIILLLCFTVEPLEIEAKQEINYLHSSDLSQIHTRRQSNLLMPLSLPKAGEAKAERPRIRRIGLSPKQYQVHSLKTQKKEFVNTQKKEKLNNGNKADSENIVVKPDDYSSSHKSLPQQHNSLLYSLVQAEAGNQDLDGCRLVADVVLNRIDSEKFPNTMEEVIYAPGQFSVIKNGAFKKAQGEISEKVVQAVDMELSGKRLNYDVLYFNNSNNGGWQYGGHYFK